MLKLRSLCRFIPSCEGQTSLTSLTSLNGTIHPLLRGADACRVSLLYGFCDSSPPARGRHARNVTASPHFRFIPSCEGQTSLNAWTTSSLTIHPLLRGADFHLSVSPVFVPDSSPPARGRPIRARKNTLNIRFIPSCEGQTCSYHIETRSSMIHPLLRGADLFPGLS